MTRTNMIHKILTYKAKYEDLYWQPINDRYAKELLSFAEMSDEEIEEEYERLRTKYESRGENND